MRPSLKKCSRGANITPENASYRTEAPEKHKTKGGDITEDREIINLFFERDERAIAEAGDKYGGMCRAVAYGILGSEGDAEECLNDAMLKAWQNIPPERPDSLGAWLGRVTRNVALSLWRKNTSRKRSGGVRVLLEELEDCLPSPENVETAVEARELSDIISRWLRTLGKTDRDLFVRRYWYCVPLKTLAAEAGISPSKLAGRMFALRAMLRRELEKEGITV